MLRLSKKADYALIAMKHLALRGDRGSSSAREIAELYDVPIELMAKVLQRLVQRGLLASQQGTRGGFPPGCGAGPIFGGGGLPGVRRAGKGTPPSPREGQGGEDSESHRGGPLWRRRRAGFFPR